MQLSTRLLKTWYNKKISSEELPAKLKFIRESSEIRNGKIQWNDD